MRELFLNIFQRHTVDLLLSSLLISLLSLALPIVLIQTYDRIIPNAAYGTLTLLASGVFVAIVLEAFLRIIRQRTVAWIGARYEYDGHMKAMHHILFARLDAIEATGSGAHLERINALNPMKDFMSGQAILTLIDMPFVLIYFALLYFIGAELVLVPVVLIFAFALLGTLFGYGIRNAGHRRVISNSRRLNFIIEVLSGIHSIKSMTIETQMAGRYERLERRCANDQREMTFLNGSSQAVTQLLTNLSMIGVVSLGSLSVINGDFTIGGLAACTLLAGRAMSPLAGLMGLWNRYQNVRSAQDQHEQIFKLPLEGTDTSICLNGVHGDLSMDGISYGPRPDGTYLLQDLSLDIKEGEQIALYGQNGVGKTTLLWLLSGAIVPEKGTALIDGIDTKDLSSGGLRPDIAYISPIPEIVSGTLIENLTMYRKDRVEQTRKIARKLGIDDIAKTLPLGYDTPLDEGAGSFLSRGSLQRIHVARMLANEPKVILFDEANSAMDMVSDKKLINYLETLRGKSTIVMVTLRPSLMKLADKVFELKDGRLTRKPEMEGAK